MSDEQLDIDGMIEALEIKIMAMQDAVSSLRKVKDALGIAGVGGSQGTGAGRPTGIHPDQFFSMSILDAVEAYLQLMGRPARATADIIDSLSKGGLRVSPDSVVTILTRSHNNDGPIVRIQKGVWGLAAWYHKRPSKLGRSTKEVIDDAVAEDKSADELIEDEAAAKQERQEHEIAEMISHDEARKQNRVRRISD